MGTKTNGQPSIIVDNDLVMYARDQLLMSAAKATNKKYPSLKYTRLFPVVNLPGYEWENSFEVVEFDAFGIAVVLADSATDGGKVGVVARRRRYPIKTISDYTEISWLAIQQSRSKNVPLEAKHGQALVFGIEKKNNSIAYDGDLDYGLKGVFTSQLPRMNAATTFAGAANPRARIDLLNNAVSTVVTNCTGMYLPTTIAMPTRQMNFLANDIYTDATGKTTLATFKENQAELGQITEFVMDDTLVGKGEGGTDAMLVLPGVNPNASADFVQPTGDDDEGMEDYPIYYAIALDFTLPDEFGQWNDQMYRERAISRVAGLVVEDPRTGLIVSGI